MNQRFYQTAQLLISQAMAQLHRRERLRRCKAKQSGWRLTTPIVTS